MPVDVQSALDAAGPQAARIEALWWLLFWVCAAVFLTVVGAVGLACRRGLSGSSRPGERTLIRGVVTATAVTIAILFGLLFASVRTGRAIATPPPSQVIEIEITGRQWWWEVTYLHPEPSLRVTTANELHLPVGRPVVFRLKSADVIHSFWIPNLHGKTDLVPGRENTTWLRVDAPGVYRGQCAEFCGLQHAHMALVAVAESPEAYGEWIEGQRRPAAVPVTAEQRLGLDVVERTACALCHTIRGTRAAARVGPDLTHLASRRTLAAGRIPNTRGHLAAWIADPQRLKPGSHMPQTGLGSDELRAVVSYLETLE